MKNSVTEIQISRDDLNNIDDFSFRFKDSFEWYSSREFKYVEAYGICKEHMKCKN